MRGRRLCASLRPAGTHSNVPSFTTCHRLLHTRLHSHAVCVEPPQEPITGIGRQGTPTAARAIDVARSRKKQRRLTRVAARGGKAPGGNWSGDGSGAAAAAGSRPEEAAAGGIDAEAAAGAAAASGKAKASTFVDVDSWKLPKPARLPTPVERGPAVYIAALVPDGTGAGASVVRTAVRPRSPCPVCSTGCLFAALYYTWQRALLVVWSCQVPATQLLQLVELCLGHCGKVSARAVDCTTQDFCDGSLGIIDACSGCVHWGLGRHIPRRRGNRRSDG